ncbi:hypothetical protein X976_5550 [Burkholderia pseudomallei MSHR7500]|nr:hypothetical protein DO63_2755 [Burkholderia pseudomallei]KGD08842.1 hypothetical protein DO70_1243 [Burkholderia pseudomallei]KGS88247.1 hypothetical protein X976_5550 [Burkholderia pseudomallei MSHR7500]
MPKRGLAYGRFASLRFASFRPSRLSGNGRASVARFEHETRSEWSAFSFARRGAARQRLRKLEVAAPAPSFYFNTAAIAFATTSRLRVLSAATQIRPVLTA